MGELRLRARARPDAQIAQDADLELLGQVGLGEGWSRLSPLIAHAQVEHLGPSRRGAVLGTAYATGRAVVGAARSTAAAQHDAGGSLARRGRFVEQRREILDRDGAQLVSRHAAEQPAKERGAVLGDRCRSSATSRKYALLNAAGEGSSDARDGAHRSSRRWPAALAIASISGAPSVGASRSWSLVTRAVRASRAHVRTLSTAPSWALLVAPCKLPRAAPNTAPRHGACGDAHEDAKQIGLACIEVRALQRCARRPDQCKP